MENKVGVIGDVWEKLGVIELNMDNGYTTTVALSLSKRGRDGGRIV